MSALLTKAGKKLFARHLEQYAPEDPLYEFYTTEKGKKKRRKRALPPGLSKRDANILQKLKSRAHYFDKGFSLCGLQFGSTFLIGLIPIVGDIADFAINYAFIIRPAQKLDLPSWLVQRMLLLGIASAAVGCIPIVGDVVVVIFKASTRSVALVEEFLRIRGEEFIKMSGEAEVEDEGWFSWFNRNKNKPKADRTKGLSSSDVEQVKPGAGMTGMELREELSKINDTQDAPVDPGPTLAPLRK